MRMTFSELLNIESDFSSKSMLRDFVAHICVDECWSYVM